MNETRSRYWFSILLYMTICIVFLGLLYFVVEAFFPKTSAELTPRDDALSARFIPDSRWQDNHRDDQKEALLKPLKEKILLELIDRRIAYKLKKFQGKKLDKGIKEEILKKKQRLKDQAEKEILSRLNAVRKYLRSPERDPHISLEEIFRQRERRNIGTLFSPVIHYFKNRKSKLLTDKIET